MPQDKRSQYEAASPTTGPDKWAQYEAAPASAADTTDTPPPSTGDLRAPTQRERFLNPDLYPVGAKGEGIGENLKNLVQRGGVGIFQLANAAMTPRQTVASILSSLVPEPVVHGVNRVVDLENKIPGAHYLTTHLPENVPNPVAQAYQAVAPGGWQAAGNVAPIAGQALAGEAFATVVPEIAADTVSGGKSFARTVTGTGPKPVEDLVKKARAENEKIDAVNQDRVATQQTKQATADANYRGDLLKLRQKYEQQVRDANQKFADNKTAAEQANAQALRDYNQKIGQVIQQRRAVAVTEQARAQAAAQTQVVGSQLIHRLNQLDHSLRDRAGVMYDAIREKVGGATMPGTSLAVAAQDAKSKISGTSETPKIFRDILGKYPSEDPETISYQGVQIPKSNRLYDVLVQHGATTSPPVTFADLQGYYSELGSELSRGTLPGDVYQATRALQDSVGGMMQKMADGAGVGKQLTAARKFYRDYMDTFHEPTGPSSSGSPIAQALLAKDPAIAVQKFAGNSGDRGIAILRRYDPNLADLAQRARATKLDTPLATRTTSKSISSVPPAKVTPVPAGANLPLPPVLPEPETIPVQLKPRRTISSDDIARARDEAATARRNWINRRGSWVASWPIFEAMRAIWGGHIPSIPAMALESAGTYAMVRATTAMMEYPPMLRFLTQARPEDVALIPPELRGDLPGLVSLARRQGIRVAPALIAATMGRGPMGSGQGQQQVEPPPPISPAQAIQAMQPASAGGAQ